MSGFQDRNVKVQPVVDGAVRRADKWERREAVAADKVFAASRAMRTVPLVEDDADDNVEVQAGKAAEVEE